jgi:DNA-binding response OmpR family regulator
MVSCLLIEPDAKERAHVKNLLDALGMDCVAAPQAESALEASGGETPDVIMMEVSGLPDAKRILKHHVPPQAVGGQTARKPVLIMYGRSSNLDVINDSIMHGVSEFLVQPFDLELLRFKLAQSGVLPQRAA